MPRIRNPIRFSEQFEVAESALQAAGVLNPTLSADTRLFIDPLLLSGSSHKEIRDGARATYEAHFGTVVKLLRGSKERGDAPWRSARRHLSFPEIKWTCLGYGANSVSGSGSGTEMTDHLIQTAKQIVDLGVEDPDLFVAMALFEEGFGPDRIGDMTANVILGDLLRFNDRVLADLGVAREPRRIRMPDGRTYETSLPVNPHVKGGAPIILVPDDILRALPIAKDWSDVADAASKSEEIRNRVNTQIAELWKVKTLKDKATMRQWALSGKDAFQTLLDMLRAVKPAAYDMARDPDGEVTWPRIAAHVATSEPLHLIVPKRLDTAGVTSVVDQIIEQFKFLIEKRRLSEELYHEGGPRPEKSAQRLFFAVAYAYCKANNLDVTPEADTGNGPVDFKVSAGFEGRVLVEIKLSTNTKLVKGYTRQLETYKAAEEAQRGYYVVLDVGSMGKKDEELVRLKNDASADGKQVSEIVFIDGTRKPSASKL